MNSWHLRMHFQNSGATFLNRAQTYHLILAFLFSERGHEYSLFLIYFFLAKSYEPLVVLVSVLNHVICKNWPDRVSFQRKVGSELT